MGDDCFSSSSIKISAICPLSKRRMKQPVRFKSCKHANCLDFWPLIKTSQSQGYKPKQASIFNASDEDLNNLYPQCNSEGRKVLRKYIRTNSQAPIADRKSSFKVRE